MPERGLVCTGSLVASWAAEADNSLHWHRGRCVAFVGKAMVLMMSHWFACRSRHFYSSLLGVIEQGLQGSFDPPVAAGHSTVTHSMFSLRLVHRESLGLLDEQVDHSSSRHFRHCQSVQNCLRERDRSCLH